MAERVNYTDDYINKLTKRKQFRAGWYQVMTTHAVCEESKAGNVQFITKETPLKVLNDPSSKARQGITNYVVTPLMPDDAPDHEPPETAIGMSMKFLRSKGIDVPEFPRKSDGGGYTFKGDSINKEVVNELRIAAIRGLMDKLGELRENPDELEGYTCYAFIDVDGEFNRIKTMRSELPEGAALVAAEDWFTPAS
jgi:hypothetical protein